MPSPLFRLVSLNLKKNLNENHLKEESGKLDKHSVLLNFKKKLSIRVLKKFKATYMYNIRVYFVSQKYRARKNFNLRGEKIWTAA